MHRKISRRGYSASRRPAQHVTDFAVEALDKGVLELVLRNTTGAGSPQFRSIISANFSKGLRRRHLSDVCRLSKKRPAQTRLQFPS